MSSEFPLAPIDTVIRRNADGLRVSAGAAEALDRHLHHRGIALGKEAARRAKCDGRNTIMAEDTDVTELPRKDELVLPIAPVDRIVRRDIADHLRVGNSARIAVTLLLETHAGEVAEGAVILARHAGRRTVQSEDIDTFVEVVSRAADEGRNAK